MDFQTRIRDIMTTDLTSVRPNTSVESFKDLFKRRGFHHLPVEDEHMGLVGIISTEDVNKASRYPVPSESLLAYHIMTPEPKTIREDKTIMDAVQLFLEQQYRALPVMDKHENLVGFITPYDLLKVLFKEQEAEKEVEDMEDRV